MKKLLVLSVLLGLIALPMFASDITFGGDVTFGFISDFGDQVNDITDATLDVMAAIDDYNSLVINIDGLENNTSASGAAPQTGIGITKALVSTDVGKWLGLPVGVMVNWGYDDPDQNEFQNISAYGNEDPWDFAPNDYWGLDFLVSVKMLEIELAFNPYGDVAPALLAGLAVKEPIPGVNAEVYYFQNGVVGEIGKGRISFDGAYSGDFGGFGVTAGAFFGYDLDDTATNAWAYGVGFEGTYSMATVTVGLDGNESDALNGITATVVVAPIDKVDIYGGLYYDGANSELVEVDLGINPHMGATEMYVGYLIAGDSPVGAGDNFNAPPGLASGDSGAYIKFDVNY
jgi:hypothetical protein